MNILLKNSKIIAYEKALEEQFNKFKKIDTCYGIINYFIDIVKGNLLYDNLSEKHPPIILIGTNIPEELVYASGYVPYWVMGGLSTTMAWSDKFSYYALAYEDIQLINPKTGDNITTYIAMFIVSLLGIIIIPIWKKCNDKYKNK